MGRPEAGGATVSEAAVVKATVVDVAALPASALTLGPVSIAVVEAVLVENVIELVLVSELPADSVVVMLAASVEETEPSEAPAAVPRV